MVGKPSAVPVLMSDAKTPRERAEASYAFHMRMYQNAVTNTTLAFLDAAFGDAVYWTMEGIRHQSAMVSFRNILDTPTNGC
jgi:hypothetical protein